MGKAIGSNAAIEQGMAGAQGLSPTDGHALAGFVDAEGSFAIQLNNRGCTWACSMSLAVRLDDGDVLTDLARSTGLGRLHTKRAYRTARPQAVWSIASKRECAQLARILRRFPLRARKRLDLEIWARAVDRWSTRPHGAERDPQFHAVMTRDSMLLRRVRRYVNSPPSALDGSSSELLAYLRGVFSGEGCFRLTALQPRAVIKLRRDDRSVLELFAARFGLGKVRDHAAYGNVNPSVTWLICATDELAAAVDLFEAAQLRGRKRREFEVWREAAHERAFAKIGGRRWDRARIQRVAEGLAELRVYRQPQAAISPASRRDAERDARRAYVTVLRAFAAEVIDGPLTCSGYARARSRHPQWPTRNTITLAFGSWAEALRAAGLASRGSDWAHRRGRASIG
jgi:LAGLIDADG DNA endonuclease family protein